MSVDIALATSALGGLCYAAVTYTPYVNSEQPRRATQYVASRVDAIGRSELSESWLRDACEKSFSFVSFFRVAKRNVEKEADVFEFFFGSAISCVLI